METMQLVDRLERLLVEGLHIPFTANVIVNEEECLRVVDRLRAVLQEEARRAPAGGGSLREGEPVVVGPVPPPIPPELAQHDLVKAARAHADQIIAEAMKQAEDLKADADNYALEELRQLQMQLEGLLRRVRNGIRKLEQEGALAPRRSREEQEE